MQQQRDEIIQQEAAKKVQEKQMRTQAFEDQRQALWKDLEDTRAEIACHEAYLKVAFSLSPKYECLIWASL